MFIVPAHLVTEDIIFRTRPPLAPLCLMVGPNSRVVCEIEPSILTFVEGVGEPYGRHSDITQEVWQALDAEGVDCCMSAYGGTNPPNFDRLNILRQAVDHNFSILAFRAAVEGWRGGRILVASAPSEAGSSMERAVQYA